MALLVHRRQRLSRLRLQAGRVEVYWRSDRFGEGPCMSYYVGRIEVLRFDLFTPAHMHRRCEPGAPRHYYPTGLPAERYVELAIADLASEYPKSTKAQAWAADQLRALFGMS